MQESIILASAKPDWSVFLESNIWYPLSMQQNNFAYADSG